MQEFRETSSVEVFARNVTGREGLGYLLIDVARMELGPQVPMAQVEQHASDLLLQSLLHVGIDPQTERTKRELVAQLLRGAPISDLDVQEGVEYILSQMVIQPKGALAECLAIAPCLNHLRTLKAYEHLPSNARFARGIWSRRLSGRMEEGKALFAEWREAADGLFYCLHTPELAASIHNGGAYQQPIGDNDLLILGVAEVKCYSHISRRKLLSQLDGHLIRLAGGLQFRNSNGRTIEKEYLPENLWYAAWRDGRIAALPVTVQPFQIGQHSTSKGPKFTVHWTAPLMSGLARFSIGPRSSKSAQTMHHAKASAFDVTLPYDQDELEEIGAAMAEYTLGAMADQPDIDLAGAEWSWNLQLALETTGDAKLSKRQLARRQKILRRIR